MTSSPVQARYLSVLQQGRSPASPATESDGGRGGGCQGGESEGDRSGGRAEGLQVPGSRQSRHGRELRGAPAEVPAGE